MGLEQWLDYRDGTEPALDAATIIAGAQRRRRWAATRLAATGGLAVIGVATVVALTASRGPSDTHGTMFGGRDVSMGTANGPKSRVVTLKIGEHYVMPGTGASVWFTDKYLCTDAPRHGTESAAPDEPKDCAPGRIAAYTGVEEAGHIPGQPAMFGFISWHGDGRAPATIKIFDMDSTIHDATIVRTADSVGVAFFSDSTLPAKWCGLHMEIAHDANGAMLLQAHSWFSKCEA